MENKGIFLYLDSISALDALCSDALKWRIVRAVVMYAVDGKLPDEKMQRNAVFLLMKSIVDNGKGGQKRKKGGVCEEGTESVNNPSVEAGVCGAKESSESAGECIVCGEEKLAQTKPIKEECEHYNKNKNKNENKTKNSSSVGDLSLAGVKNKNVGLVEEEEKKRSGVVSVPTLDEVRDFIRATNVNVDPVCFFSYHEAKEWRVGGRIVGDWRACVLEWDRRERRKEIREREKNEKVGSRKYTKKELEEIDNDFVDLSKVDDVKDFFM